MKTIKIILGIFLILGAIVSLIGFFKNLTNYNASDSIGHIIAILLISWLAYFLLKPKKA